MKWWSIITRHVSAENVDLRLDNLSYHFKCVESFILQHLIILFTFLPHSFWFHTKLISVISQGHFILIPNFSLSVRVSLSGVRKFCTAAAWWRGRGVWKWRGYEWWDTNICRLNQTSMGCYMHFNTFIYVFRLVSESTWMSTYLMILFKTSHTGIEPSRKTQG